MISTGTRIYACNCVSYLQTTEILCELVIKRELSTRQGRVGTCVCFVFCFFNFKMNTLFSHRYAQLCQNLLEENVETGDQFCKEFLPSLLFLLSDPVPNVRLSLARTLSQSVMVSGTVVNQLTIE